MDDLMNLIGPCEYELPQRGEMNVPGRLFADQATVDQLIKDEVHGSQWSAVQQIRHVTALPGILDAAIALPDVHPGYGFPIGGIAAFEKDRGVVVVGGVGFDINCGVRMLATPLTQQEIAPVMEKLGKALFDAIPAGLGVQGRLRLIPDSHRMS